MYSEVTLSDSSWVITAGYELVSVVIFFLLYFLRVKARRLFVGQGVLTVLLVLVFSFIQYQIIRYGADDLYEFFGYKSVSGSVVRVSAMFYFLVYILMIYGFKSKKL